MDSKWMFALVNGVIYIWAYQIRKKSICVLYHKEGCAKSCMVFVWRFYELAREAICDKDLFNGIAFLQSKDLWMEKPHSLEIQYMTLLTSHCRVLGSRTWNHILYIIHKIFLVQTYL